MIKKMMLAVGVSSMLLFNGAAWATWWGILMNQHQLQSLSYDQSIKVKTLRLSTLQGNQSFDVILISDEQAQVGLTVKSVVDGGGDNSTATVSRTRLEQCGVTAKQGNHIQEPEQEVDFSGPLYTIDQKAWSTLQTLSDSEAKQS